MSAFLDLRDAVKALLMQTPALSGFVEGGHNVPLPAEMADGIFVRLVRGNGQMPHVGDSQVDWGTVIIVTCLKRAAPGQDGDTAVDPLLMATYQRLAAGPLQPTQDAWTLDPVIDWDVEEANETIGGAALRLVVQHRTADGVLTPAT